MTDNRVFWKLEQAQSDRISKLLDVDFSAFGILGGWMAPHSPQVNCVKCGKLCGLDDVVHNVLKSGAHSREFLLNAFLGDGHGGPAHSLECSECGTTFMKGNDVFLLDWAEPWWEKTLGWQGSNTIHQALIRPSVVQQAIVA